MNYDYLVDASGDVCPMPLLKAKMQLNKMQLGECLKVIATDAGSVRDFVSFIELTKHELMQETDFLSGQQSVEQAVIEQSDMGSSVFVYYIIKR